MSRYNTRKASKYIYSLDKCMKIENLIISTKISNFTSKIDEHDHTIRKDINKILRSILIFTPTTIITTNKYIYTWNGKGTIHIQESRSSILHLDDITNIVDIPDEFGKNLIDIFKDVVKIKGFIQVDYIMGTKAISIERKSHDSTEAEFIMK